MSDGSQPVIFENEHIDLMAQAMSIAHRQSLAEGRAEETDMAQKRLARVIMAIVKEGASDPEAIAKAALERLSGPAGKL